MKKYKKNLIISLSIIIPILLVVFIIIPFVLIKVVKDKYLDKKYYYEPFIKTDIKLYNNMTREDISFISDKNQTIKTYLYKNKIENYYKGLIIISHCFLVGGHQYYLSGIDFFINNKFLVIGYDGTGNGESDKISMQGFEQGVIDLENLIKIVKSDTNLNKYPLFLLGHSWGGYNVGAVLNKCPDVDGVIQIAVFNSISQITRTVAEDNAGNFAPYVKYLMPYINIDSTRRFNSYSDLTCVDGFKNTKAKILIISSLGDATIPTRAGIDIFKKEFKNDNRFTFYTYNNKPHEFIDYNFDDSEYLADFIRYYRKLYYDKFLQPIGDTEEKEFYTKNLFDQEAYLKHIDLDFYNDILKFIDNTLVSINIKEK